ncbi:MAG TPA: MraY family glycosyltransferase [Steroidobacteraceae bacterium]|jgi:UDP-GlcNAc:undecaprenyl-phosphate GlcNAc-1-phosphate transferase|nr:MraY family glycosyltransferase [Steroidobacteraceae bacterium]
MPALVPFNMLVLAAAASMFLIPPLCRVAPRLGLVDLPDPRKVHTTPIPRVGGWGITLGMLFPLLFLLPDNPLMQSFVIGALILFGFGVWDDAREIGHWPKFIGQIAAAVLVVYYGDLYITSLPFVGDGALSPLFGRLFTVFALVGAINAVNHSDGLDGLASGECLLSLIALASLGYLADSSLVMAMALAAIGGIIGFLRYNSHPARVFMGDCGSQVLGFTVAFLIIYLTQVGDSALSSALPLLLLGVPISDILAVLYQRIAAGNNWFKASRNHIHHRLLDLGFRHFEAVIIIYSVQALLVVSAVLLRYQSDAIVTGVYLLVIVSLFTTLTFGESRGWRRDPQRSSGIFHSVSRLLGWLAHSRAVREAPRILITVSVPAMLLLGPLGVARVPHDVAWIAAGLAAIVAMQIGRSRANGSTLVRLAVYVAAIASVYLFINYPAALSRPLQPLVLTLIAALAIAIGGYLKFASDQKFGTTPTDFLILFVMLALLIFGNLDIGARALVEIVVYAVVLLYSCEVLINLTVRRWNVLHLSTLASLTIMVVRGAT